MTEMHIGFDDTDSPRKGCTTYIAAVLVEELLRREVFFADYPNLIRLNPNVPWKTRGNGALCLRIRCQEDLVGEIMEVVIDTVQKESDLEYSGTDPGVVFFFGNVPQKFKDFAKSTIQGLVEKKDALKLIKTFDCEVIGFKRGRGIVGGLAAIGEMLEEDYTFEFIAYRKKENYGTPRRVHSPSIFEMNEKTKHLTFNNIDPDTGRILITPRGADPILFGIRGENSKIVRLAYEMVLSEEKIERCMIFRTNQGTDAHLNQVSLISEMRPFSPVSLQGSVLNKPKVIPGGHVIFSCGSETGEVDCAAYEPTGFLREVAKKLDAGDIVKVHGGVRRASIQHRKTVNLEKLEVMELAPKIHFFNPTCPRCRARMKSMGKEKGFRCKKCGFRSLEIKKVAVEACRSIKRGIYVTPPRSQRHLTKPLCRYGLEKTFKTTKTHPSYLISKKVLCGLKEAL